MVPVVRRCSKKTTPGQQTPAISAGGVAQAGSSAEPVASSGAAADSPAPWPTEAAVAADAPPTQPANATADLACDFGGALTVGELEKSMRHVLAGQDLKSFSLKALRRAAVSHLGLSKKVKKQLEGTFRHAFADVAQRVVGEMQANAQEPPPDWMSLEDEDASTAVYLVTFAKILQATAEVVEPPLKVLDGLTREDIRDAVLSAVQHPVVPPGRGGRRQETLASVVKLVVAKEEPLHFHVALSLSKRVAFLPYKTALRAKAGLASHWSTTHREFWSAVRYIHFTSEKKCQVDTDKLCWSASGAELNLYEESQEPWTAAAYKAKREARDVRKHADDAAPSAGKRGKLKFEKLDFYALVQECKLSSPAAVLHYAQDRGSHAMREFVVKNQRKLDDLLSDVKQWASAAEVAADERRSDWQLVNKLARQRCACGNGVCQWWEAAETFFERNSGTIDRQALASSLARVICHGPTKTSRVPLIVGCTNSGKSTMLTPTTKVFGFANVVHRPGEKATMALANVTKARKRFIFWDEYRPVELAARGSVPVGTFLSLFGGAPLEIQVSQSFNDGNAELIWRKGAAMTAKEEGLWDALPSLPGLTPVTREDIRHMQSRVEQFHATVPVPPGSLAAIPDCKETWCRWLVADAATFATRSVERPVRVLAGRPPPRLPDGEADVAQGVGL